MVKNKGILTPVLAILMLASLVLPGCTPAPTSTPPTRMPTRSPVPTATPVPLPSLTLEPGEFYFRLDGRPAMLFSRNLAGSEVSQYLQELELTQSNGSCFVRIQLDSMGTGMVNNGEIDEAWAIKWESVFDKAEEYGIYILPVFSGWFDWNNGENGENFFTWNNNAFNAVNGGPADHPAGLLQEGSTTQQMWLVWMGNLVERWQNRHNILGWEIFSEVNLITGTSEQAGVTFIENAATVIRANDPLERPVTASIAEIGEWPSFYRSGAIDYINAHPYPSSAQLDRFALDRIQHLLFTYGKPIIIGESGLNAESPENYPPNADIGLRHAIWAEVVSGSANARALYWEDGFGIFFPSLDWPWVRAHAQLELAAARFVQNIDFTGFTPLRSATNPGVWGAAVGNESMVLGWFRDAASEPPDWTVQTIPAGQTVNLTIPGTAAAWQVDFYDTTDGTTIVSSTSVTRQGSIVSVSLPEFQDDIAFKMMAGSETSGITPEVIGNTNDIAGTWSGSISNNAGTFTTLIDVSIQSYCEPGRICGTFAAPQLPCSGALFLQEIAGETFVFIEQNVTGAASCTSGGVEYLQPLPDGTLSYLFTTTPGSADTSSGILAQP